jgi:carboxymethylenebutenolidase
MATGERIDIAVGDETVMRAYVAVPWGAVKKVGVIVAHELFGVNPDIEDVVNELADAGHVAVAPELYWRSARPTAGP